MLKYSIFNPKDKLSDRIDNEQYEQIEIIEEIIKHKKGKKIKNVVLNGKKII